VVVDLVVGRFVHEEKDEEETLKIEHGRSFTIDVF